MPGFLDKIKSGADKAAFEADRLRRVSQAQSALRALQNELETQVAAIGQQVLALYDAGTLTQSELLALCPPIDSLREQIVAQGAEVERIRQEKPPEAPSAAAEQPAEARGPVAERPPEPPTPVVEHPPATPTPVPQRSPAPPPPALQGHICPQCQVQLRADVRFCPECGSRAVDA